MYRIKKNILAIVIIIFSLHSVRGQSSDFDKKLGEKNFNKVVNTYGLYNNNSMTSYIDKVGQRLVAQLDSALFDYHFYIIDEEIPNAFALPGGYIFITKGIIPILNTEDELAGIIGHEIIHSNNRHTVRQLRKKILPGLLTLPINIVEKVVPGAGILTSPITTAKDMLYANYSRKFETEADEQGVTIAAKAGYDPLALTRALNRLSETIKYMTGEKEKRSYFANHPYTADREKNISSIAKNLEFSKTENITKDFVQEFSGIIYGSNPSKGVLKDNALIQGEKDIYIQYPKHWHVDNLDTLVSGYSPSKTTAYILSFEKNKLKPEEAAKKYIANAPKKYKKMIVKSEPTKINKTDGYIINLEEPSYNDTTFVSLIWFNKGDNFLKISTITDIKNNNTLKAITNSIRALNKKEKESIMVKYVNIEKANDNETITSLCKRTNNTTSVELISILNGIDANKKLNKGKEIKIILEKPYN